MADDPRTDAAIVESAIQLVRRGAFTSVFQDQNFFNRLNLLADGTDWLAYQSRAIVAEIYDQIGLYKEAGSLVTRELGAAQLQALDVEVRKEKPVRRVVRAHAWLILQCAVSQFRKTGGQTSAAELLSNAIQIVSANKGEAVDSQHIQSLFYFWRGRIHTSRYAFSTAEKDFTHALHVADQTLKEKLDQVETHQYDEDAREQERYRQITAGNYVLSTCLGFGLGQLRQLEGRLLDSLQFLRVAVPLSRGSGDFHRRGYAHLLMGTALRSQNDLDAADVELAEAERLLGGGSADTAGKTENIFPHKLHLARVYYQQSLSKYNRAQLGHGRSSGDEVHLSEANTLVDKAEEFSNGVQYAGYQDPVLNYGITVARSLINTGLGNYQKAQEQAHLALRNIKELPHWTHGWAWVAKGMALAEAVTTASQVGEIRDAENAFEEAIDGPHIRLTDRAAAHLHLSRLYSKIGQPFRAAVHYDRGESLVKDTEHGWIKDLRDTAKQVLRTSLGPELNIDLSQLLEAAAAKNSDPWSYINKFVGIELKRRVLHLKRDTLAGEDGALKAAQELGITRATIFNWKRDPDLTDLFPKSKTNREKKPHGRK